MWTTPREELEAIVDDSLTFTEILARLGFRNVAGRSRDLRRRLVAEGIDFSHVGLQVRRPGMRLWLVDDDDVFVENSACSRGVLKRLIIKHKILPYECKRCGVEGVWNNKPMVLVLDHINGVHCDNRIDNLQFLCHNCHSQTATFTGRNPNRTPPVWIPPTVLEEKAAEKAAMRSKSKRKAAVAELLESRRKKWFCSACGSKVAVHPKHGREPRCPKCSYLSRRKVSRPSKEELEKMLWEIPTVAIAEKFGVSDKAVSKWAKSYGLTKPPRGYWSNPVNNSPVV